MESTKIKHNDEEFLIADLVAEHSPKLFPLSEIEKRIIEARSTGLSISEYSDSTIKREIGHMIVKISIISGHKIPHVPEEEPKKKKSNKKADDDDDEPLQYILADEVIFFLKEHGYENFTIEELLTAFRINCSSTLKYPSELEATHVNVFGEFMSVDYISQVMKNYWILRERLDRKLCNAVDGIKSS